MYCARELGLIILTQLLLCFQMLAQGNCTIYPENSGERKACELSYQALEFRQGSKESQLLFDEAIRTGPNFAYAYYQKAVPFYKRGMFAEGVSLINQAIKLEPENYLHYRAYWYFYQKSYDCAIKDLEELYTVHNTNYVTTPGGELEMRLLLALAYAQKNEFTKGIRWINDLMEEYKKLPHLKGIFDHFCLGVLYFLNQQYDLAEKQFKDQLLIDSDFANTYYYLGLIENMRFNTAEAQKFFSQALSKMNRKNGGYSTNLFAEFNTSKEDIVKMIQPNHLEN